MHAQDKVVMREAARRARRPVPAARGRRAPPTRASPTFGFPCVLKTTRGGYDGKGVWFVGYAGGVRAGRSRRPPRPACAILAEERVDFRRELSALVARSPQRPGRGVPGRGVRRSATASAARWSPRRPDLDRRPRRRRPSRSRCGSPASSTSPGSSPSSCSRPATGGCWSTSSRCARTTPATGPRTARSPRSSRTTCAPCSTCRSARPAPARRWTVMVNILGGPADAVGRLYDGYPHALARDPRLRVHLYGKEPRPGRKVGHVNAYGDDLEECLRAGPARRGVVPRRPGRRERVSRERSTAPRVGIVMGSDSDWPVMKAAAEALRGVRRRLRGRRRLGAPDARRDARLRPRGRRPRALR